MLITGINGLLGAALTEHLLAAGRSFLGVDLGQASNPALPAERFLSVDLRDHGAVSALFEQRKPRIVIHGAAMTAVDACETERSAAWAVNVDATAHIARLCQQHGARLVYVSTDYVFDGKRGQYTEDDGLSPLGVYAVTKAAGELAARSLCRDHVVARTAVPFGPFAHVKKDFVRWLRDELTAGRPVRIVRDQISNPTYAPDLARMLVQLCDGSFQGTVHTCGATSLDRFELAQRIARTFALRADLMTPILTSDLKQAAPRPLDAGMSVARANSLGLQPLSIDEALLKLRKRLEGAA